MVVWGAGEGHRAAGGVTLTKICMVKLQRINWQRFGLWAVCCDLAPPSRQPAARGNAAPNGRRLSRRYVWRMWRCG
jgi:hypothetical protein